MQLIFVCVCLCTATRFAGVLIKLLMSWHRREVHPNRLNFFQATFLLNLLSQHTLSIVSYSIVCVIIIIDLVTVIIVEPFR